MEIAKILHGSHLYGLNTENSDKDYKGIFIPEIRDMVLCSKLGNYKDVITSSTGNEHGKNTSEDIDIQSFSLSRFVYECLRGEMIAIDMLHCPPENILIDSPEYKYLREHRAEFYSRDMKAYIGYIRRQVHKYGVKGSRLSLVNKIIKCIKDLPKNSAIGEFLHILPVDNIDTEIITKEDSNGNLNEYYRIFNKTFHHAHLTSNLLESMNKIVALAGDRAKKAMENEGVDWKAVSHAFRACYQLQDIYEKGDIQLPFEGDRKELLLKVKNGELDFSYSSELLDEEIAKTMELSANSEYPETPDFEKWTEWVTSTYVGKLR